MRQHPQSGNRKGFKLVQGDIEGGWSLVATPSARLGQCPSGTTDKLRRCSYRPLGPALEGPFCKCRLFNLTSSAAAGDEDGPGRLCLVLGLNMAVARQQ